MLDLATAVWLDEVLDVHKTLEAARTDLWWIKRLYARYNDIDRSDYTDDSAVQEKFSDYKLRLRLDILSDHLNHLSAELAEARLKAIKVVNLRTQVQCAANLIRTVRRDATELVPETAGAS